MDQTATTALLETPESNGPDSGPVAPNERDRREVMDTEKRFFQGFRFKLGTLRANRRRVLITARGADKRNYKFVIVKGDDGCRSPLFRIHGSKGNAKVVVGVLTPKDMAELIDKILEKEAFIELEVATYC